MRECRSGQTGQTLLEIKIAIEVSYDGSNPSSCLWTRCKDGDLLKNPNQNQMRYKAKKINGKTRQVHRLVMEEHLGRKLKSSEVVHHIDGDKSNNKLNNLILFPTKSAHTKFHLQKGDLKLLNGNNKKELSNGKLKCVKCGIWKELKDFTKNVKAYLGVIGVCKNCRKLQKRHWKR